jgi:membrane-bound ClpP family serine protease
MVFILFLVVRWRNRQRLLGPSATALVFADGAIGSVRSMLSPVGIVYAAGEEWTARSADDRPLPPGTSVRVVGQEGLTLIVEPTESPG